MRQAREEPIEHFGATVLDESKDNLVRKAIKRELLEAARGVSSELPAESALLKMQIPPLSKLLVLPSASLSLSR